MKREILQGDSLAVLKTLPKESVHCIITSPPYWGLRDYGVDGQLGLEATWKEHLDNLQRVFRECKRVLHRTGSLWVNYGDTVVQNPRGGRGTWDEHHVNGYGQTDIPTHKKDAPGNGPRKHKIGLHWRVRFMLNDRLGFISRADIVWWKRNAMPLSMKDRVTPKYEMLFHMVKDPKYWFDLNAIRIPFSVATVQRADMDWSKRNARGSVKGHAPGQKPRSTQRNFNIRVRDAAEGHSLCSATSSEVAVANLPHLPPIRPSAARKERPIVPNHPGLGVPEPGNPETYDPLGANPGDVWDAIEEDVWDIPSAAFKEGHFATFPEEIPKRAILATCPREICVKCGTPRRTVVETTYEEQRGAPRMETDQAQKALEHGVPVQGEGFRFGTGRARHQPIGLLGCECGADTMPGVVLDPFAGAFTTCLAAAKLGRDFIGIELNPAYVEIGRRRLATYLNPLSSFVTQGECQDVETEEPKEGQ